MPEELIPLAEAARRAGVTRSALLHAHRKGRIVLGWFGPVRGVTVAELERYVASRRTWKRGGHPRPRRAKRAGDCG